MNTDGATYEWDTKVPVHIFDNRLIALNYIFAGL
jgi:hypothetical protein